MADFTFTPNNSPAPANVTFTNSSTGSPTSYVWNFGDGSPTSSETNPTHRYSEPGTYQVSLTATNASGSDTELKTVTVVAPGQPGGFLFRPITSQQRNNNFHADGLWSHATDQGAFQFTNDFFSDLSPFPNSDTVVANSGEVGVPVYAAADGFVLSVRKMSEMQCPGVNYIPIVGCLLMYTRLTISPGQARVSPYTISNRDLWEVVVSYGDDTLRYYVGNPENYIYEGMQLRAGCIVGEAVELTPLRPAQLQVGGTAEAAIGAGQVGTLGGGGTANVFVEWGDQFSGGVTFIQRRNASNVPQPLISFLTQEPDPVTACNASGPLSECFDDPYFENRNLWTATNPSLVTWGYSYQIGGGIGGVLLEPGAGIFYSRALDTQAAYSFIVYASLAQPGRGRIQLSLGQTVSPSYAVTSTSLAAFAIDFAQHTPDTANLYKVQIANVGSVPIVLKGNCLTANQNYAPDVCYFQNYSFDRGSDEWSLYGVVGGGNTQDGELWMTDGSAIGQNVQLYPDTGGPHVYQFTVTYYFEAVGETPTTPYPTVQLQYRFNNDAWSNFGTAATYSSRLLRTSSQTMTHQISVATPITGEFRLTAVISPNGYAGNLIFNVRSVCIDDDFKHHPGGGGTNLGGSVPVGPDPELCAAVPRPADSSALNVGEWVNYLWLRLRNTYQCDVIPPMRSILSNVRKSLDTIQWLGLYAQGMGEYVSAWVGFQVVPWLNGHFNNMAFGRTTTIVQADNGCNNVFCLLQLLIERVFTPLIELITTYGGQIVDLLLKLARTALELLADIAAAIVRLIVEIINLITTLVQYARTYLFAMSEAMNNAQPVQIPALPQCSEFPQSSPFCSILHAMGITVFADEGALIIPIFIAIIAVGQLVWLARELPELIERLGSAL